MKNATIKICSAQDCNRPQRVKKLCTAHYGRLRRTGTLDTDTPIRVWYKGAACSSPFCTRQAISRGLCHHHYHTMRAKGLLGDTRTCDAYDCDRVLYAKGMCRYHYIKERKSTKTI